MSSTFVHVVLNPFTHDARVLRAASLGTELGGRVSVLAMQAPGLPARETIGGVAVRRFGLVTRPLPRRRVWQMLKYAELAGRMTAAGVRAHPDLVHAHDLNALPIGWAIARLTGARLVYDSHELWADRSPGETRPGWFMRAGLRAERFFGRRSDAVVTVSDGIAELLRRDAGLRVEGVVRNLPVPAEALPADGAGKGGPLRRALGVGPEDAVLLYQGGLHPGRGLEGLVEAVARLPRGRAVLVFLGAGSLRPALEERAAALSLGSDVRFLDAVPPGELVAWTRGATLGLHPIEDRGLNHRYCLPNKLFEYIQAGVPVLVSDLPEMRRVVEEYRVGETCTPGDPAALAERIGAMLSDPARLATYRRNTVRAASELNWNREKGRLAAVYRSLLGEPGGEAS
jgi:glycosyltransferase involved in cell wall biosynthesis